MLLAEGRVWALEAYVGNPGSGIHCHPLDSVNPGFIWRAPLVNPLGSCTGMHKMGPKESRFGIVVFAARIAHVGLEGSG